jgi:biopolymer transport protein ExbD
MKRFDQINVIPFIDIMLVLLAIVLTTATFISQGQLDITVPSASKSLPAPDAIKPVSIAIDAQHQMYIDETLVSLAVLKTRIETLSVDTPISLRIDQQVPFQRFVEVIDLLKQRQLNRLSIITRKTS